MSSNSQSLSVLATNNAWSSDVISDGYAYLRRDKIVVVVELYWAQTLTVDKCRWYCEANKCVTVVAREFYVRQHP